MQTMTLLVASLWIAGQAGTEGLHPGRRYAKVTSCVVSSINDVPLPAQEAGILKELAVREGDRVTEGQVVGKIDDTDALARKKEAQFKLDIAREKATNKSEVEVAHKIIELAKAEYEESKAINERSPGSIPEQQMRRQKVQWEKAILDAAVADMNFAIAGLDQKVAEVALEAVNNELERRTLRAPFDGVIERVFRQEDEWVQPGDPVVRVVRMDRLRVQGFLDAEQFAPDEVLGAPVTVKVKLAGGQETTFHSKIGFVSPVVEASGEYRVWTEVDNQPGSGGYPWAVRPGLNAEMYIELKNTRP